MILADLCAVHKWMALCICSGGFTNSADTWPARPQVQHSFKLMSPDTRPLVNIEVSLSMCDCGLFKIITNRPENSGF